MLLLLLLLLMVDGGERRSLTTTTTSSPIISYLTLPPSLPSLPPSLPPSLVHTGRRIQKKKYEPTSHLHGLSPGPQKQQQ